VMRSGFRNLDIFQRALLDFSASKMNDLVLPRPSGCQPGLALAQLPIHQDFDVSADPVAILPQ